MHILRLLLLEQPDASFVFFDRCPHSNDLRLTVLDSIIYPQILCAQLIGPDKVSSMGREVVSVEWSTRRGQSPLKERRIEGQALVIRLRSPRLYLVNALHHLLVKSLKGKLFVEVAFLLILS